jgi:hypothetical protein
MSGLTGWVGWLAQMMTGGVAESSAGLAAITSALAALGQRPIGTRPTGVDRGAGSMAADS